MIAPLREPPSRSGSRARGLSAARRALAAALFTPDAPSEPSPPRVATWLAWLFVVWTVGVAVSYFALDSWWSIPTY